jgi:HEAT repeat protein
MRLRPSALLLGLGLAVASFSPAPPGDPSGLARAPADPVARDAAALAAEEQALQTATRADDAAAALEYFRKRTPPEAQRRRLRALVRELADDSFEVRQKAAADLVASGPVATAPLRAAARSSDAEVAGRAQSCLAQIRRGGAAPVQAGVKLVIQRRPAGTLAALLDYLPFAEDGAVAEEIRAALAVQVARDEKPDPVLLRALDGADTGARAEAGIILARSGRADARAAVRRLLTDDDATVRLRVARALADAKARDALPALIELFHELAGDDRWEVEDFLERVAGEAAPAVPRDDAPDTRGRRRQAWRAWWQAHGDKVDLDRLEPRRPSADRTLLVYGDLLGTDGLVIEIGADAKPRRRLEGLHGPIAVEGLAGGRVLIAEYGGKRVTERTWDGRVTWEKTLSASPVAVQRLADGHTFVACRNRLLEIDRDGREVAERRRPVRDVLGARRHRDGSTALITHDGRCRWLDASGRETSSFPTGSEHVIGVAIDVLPNKRVLVPCYGEDRVAEYDATGRLLWQATAVGAASAERLGDGHTLVGSTMQPHVVELDRTGRVVWQYLPDRLLNQATRRQ